MDFDPNAPFEVVGGATPPVPQTGFDPNAPFEVVGSAPAAPAPSRLGVNVAEGFRNTIVGEAVERTRSGQVASQTGAAAIAAANAAEAAGSAFGLEQVGGAPSPYAGIPVARLREMGGAALTEGAARAEDFQTRVLPERRAEEAALPSWNEGGIIDRAVQGGTALAGQVLGSLASPESFVGPVGATGRRMAGEAVAPYLGRQAAQSGVPNAIANVGADAVVQTGETQRGQREGYDPVQAAFAAALGGLIGTGLPVTGEVARSLAARVAQRRAARGETTTAPDAPVAPQDLEAVLTDADVLELARANGITDPTDPRVQTAVERLAARRAAETTPEVAAVERRAAAGAPPATGDRGLRFEETRQRTAAQAAVERIDAQVGREAAAAAEAGRPYDAAATRRQLLEAEANPAAPAPDVIALPEGPGVPMRGTPDPNVPGLAEGVELRSGVSRSTALVPVEPQPNRMTPGEVARARAQIEGGTPNAAEPPPRLVVPDQGAPRTPGEDFVERTVSPRAPLPTTETGRIEAQIGRLTARGEPAPGTPAADQVARLRATLQQIEGPPARPALPAPARPDSDVVSEVAPPGQGATQRGAGRPAGGGVAAPAPGAAPEGGAPPRGATEIPPQPGAPDAASAAPARPPEAPPSNVSQAPARAVPDGVTVYRNREEFSQVRRAGRRAEGAVERLTRNGEPAPGSAAARQLEKARAAVDAGRRASYDPEAPDNPRTGEANAEEGQGQQGRPRVLTPDAPRQQTENPRAAQGGGFRVESDGGDRYRIIAGGEQVGRATLIGPPGSRFLEAIEVAPAYRGRGQALYDTIERASGERLGPSPLGLTPQTAALWSRRLARLPDAEVNALLDRMKAAGVEIGARPESIDARFAPLRRAQQGTPDAAPGPSAAPNRAENPARPGDEGAAPRAADGGEGGAGPVGTTPLYANPLGDPAAFKRFLIDPVANTARLLKDRLKTSVASIGTTPGAGAAFRLYADSDRATLLHYRERFANVPGFPEMVDSLGATDPGSGRVVRGGFQETADAQARTLGNRAATIMRPLGDDAAALGRVRDILTGQNPRGATTADRDVARRLRGLLDEHHAWLSKRLGSVDREMGYVRGRYFPRRFDAEAIQADLKGFTRDAAALYRRMGLDADQARLAADEWANRVMGVGSGAARYADTPSSSYTKGRTLPPEADTLMRKWMVTDPREAVIGYLQSSTRHAEFVSRFGAGGARFSDVMDGVVKAGATPTEVAILERAFAAATGTAQGAGTPTTGLLSWSQMWGMQQLLTRALFSSAVEPISVGSRSGDLRDSATALADTWRRFATPKAWQSSAMKMETERAEMLGVLGDSTREMMMAARVEGQNVSAKHARQIDAMLTITGQNRLFAASRIASSRIAEHTIVKMVRDTKDPRAAGFLAEVGMDAPTAATVRAWLNKHDGRPPVAEMVGDTPAANAYRTAVNRFVNESVINPLAIDKPIGASERHPLAQLGYGIMSFQYAFTRNVLIRTIKMGGRGLVDKMTAGERVAMLVPAVGLFMLSMAQMGMSDVRDAIFNRQARTERPPFVDYVLRLDRAGLFGNLSPLVNLVTSAKYERDASGALAGPYVGNMLRQAGDMTTGWLPPELGGNNSPRTNNAEWAATRAAWGLIAAPAAVGVLASTPMPAWLKPAAGAAAMYVGSSDMSRTVATTVAGPRQQAGRTGGRRPEGGSGPVLGR